MRLTFVMPADLREGRGTENVLLNLLKFRPSDIEITIVETDLLQNVRKTENELKSFLIGTKVIKIHTCCGKKRFYGRLFEIYRTFFKKCYLRDLSSLEGGKILSEIRQTDIVYLFENHYAVFFSDMPIPIIGSDHIFNSVFFRSSAKRIKRALLEKNYKLYYKNINGFHKFPHLSENLNTFNKMRYALTLPNGVDCRQFYPNFDLAKTYPKLRLLFVGSLELAKGIDILLKVLRRLAGNEQLEFHIVGTGPMESSLKQFKSVIFHGRKSDRDLALIYRQMDVFIYPSHVDTYSLVVLQALASGLYVLTGQYLTGIFDDFEIRSYLEYLQLNDRVFASRILEILGDRKTLRFDKHELFKYVKSRYDWSVIAPSFYDFIRNSCKEHTADLPLCGLG